jgi:hypothetical protein
MAVANPPTFCLSEKPLSASPSSDTGSLLDTMISRDTTTSASSRNVTVARIPSRHIHVTLPTVGIHPPLPAIAQDNGIDEGSFAKPNYTRF